MEGTQASRARFGGFELDLRVGELHGNGESVLLPEQVFQVLQVLLDRRGGLVTRDELKKKLWPNDTVVEFEHGINNTIKRLRYTLQDSAEEPRYIETIPRRGYRLMVPVEWVEALPTLSPKAGDKEPALSLPNGGAPALTPAEAATLTGRTVSHYRVLDIIGGGGMGVVYRAEDLKLGRQVALKFLPDELGSEPQALERFSREARAASSLDHPNICPIHEFGEHEGRPFIVMQLLEGQTLRDRLAAVTESKTTVPLAELLDIAIQVSEGLQAAHEKGIIHRDIKPANIFLTSKGVVKILDFGLAKLVEAGEKDQAPPSVIPSANTFVIPGDDLGVIPSAERSEASRDPYSHEELAGIGVPRLLGRPLSRTTSLLGMTHENLGAPEAAPLHPAIPADAALTLTGAAMGTAGYMSPEQVRGEKLDARTDIFSFGLVLYEMATGQRAFAGETAAIVHDAIVNNPPVPLRDLNSAVPANLVTIVNKALDKDREVRYQSAAEMRTDLERVHPKSALPLPSKWKLYAATAALIALVVAGPLYLRSRQGIRFTNKDTIVVAHVINTTGDAVLDDALDWPLTRELQESPYLTVLYPSKVLDTLKLLKVPNVSHAYTPQGPKLTPELARQVCLRSNSRAFVMASIANLGNYYHIALNALDCHSGKTLAKVERDASARSQIIETLGAAGHQLRRELGETDDSLRRFNTPLEDETSGLLEALQAFNEGMRIWYLQSEAAAIPQLKRAVELDPNFASAHRNLAGAYGDSGEVSLAAGHLTMAFDLRERLSQRSRWLVEAVYYSSRGEMEKAIATNVQWLQTFPADVYPHQNLVFPLRSLGQHERAAAEARDAARLLPNILTYDLLLPSLIYMNRLEDAKAVLNEVTAKGLDSASLRAQRYWLAFLEGDRASMQEQLDWAMEKPGAEEGVLYLHSYTEAYYGHFRSAHRYMLLAIEAARQSDASNSGANYGSQETLWESEAGVVGARQRAIKVLAGAPGRDAKLRLALALARARDADVAEGVADELGKEFPVSTVMQKFHLPTIRAAIQLDRNNPRRALEILQPTAPYEMADTESFDELWPAYVRGLAYLQAGDGQHAATEFQKLLDHSGVVGPSVTGPLAHLQLGRAQVMMGDKAAARKSYQNFLTLWKDADPDIPIYRQAKAEYAKVR